MKLIPVVGAGLLAWWLLTKKSIDALNYYFKGISFDFDGITPVIKLTLAIQNIANRSFNVTGFTGVLYAGSKSIGNVSQFNPVVIMPHSETLYSVNIRLSPIALVSDIVAKIAQKQGLEYELNLIGTLNAEGLLIPVNFKFVI